MYSPQGVKRLWIDAVKEERGDIEAIFNNSNKYRKLVELWYASALAVALYRWRGIEFYLYPSENPDIHFIAEVNKPNQQGFSVEIMTLYKYKQDVFDRKYVELARGVWETKGKTDYGHATLLLVSRLNGEFNVDEFNKELMVYQWSFDRIFLIISTSANVTWTVFDLYSVESKGPGGKITIKVSDLPY